MLCCVWQVIGEVNMPGDLDCLLALESCTEELKERVFLIKCYNNKAFRN